MTTKYNIGETVLLKATIKSIKVTSDKVEYSVVLSDKMRNVCYDEDDIYCGVPVEGGINNGEDSNKETGC